MVSGKADGASRDRGGSDEGNTVPSLGNTGGRGRKEREGTRNEPGRRRSELGFDR